MGSPKKLTGTHEGECIVDTWAGWCKRLAIPESRIRGLYDMGYRGESLVAEARKYSRKNRRLDAARQAFLYGAPI